MKTISLKKVSAVAVASLGFGLLSVVPVNAAVLTATITSISLAKSTSTPTQGTAMAVNFGSVIPAQSITGAGDTMRFQAAWASVPTGGSTSITAARGLNGVTANITTAGSIPTYQENLSGTSAVIAGGALNLVTSAGTNATNLAGGTITASASSGSGSFAFTPTKAGTYVMTVWHDAGTPDGLVNAAEVSQTISIVVAAAASLAPASSIVRMAGAGTLAITANPQVSDAAYTTAIDSVPRSASVGATAATRNGIAKVQVILLNNDGTAASGNHTVDCQVTGSGLCVIDESGTANTTGGVRAFSFTNTGTKNVSVVHLITDGTAGPGTVTIAVTDSVSGVRTVIGTKSFTSFGSVSKLEVSTKNYTIGRAGFTTGFAATARTAATTVGNAAAASTVTVTSGTSTTPAFIVKATDANGNAVTTAAAPTIVSGTPSVVTGGTCLLDDGAVPTISSSTNGVGFYNCDFTTAAAAASGSKATLTIRVLDPADADGVKFLTTTLDVTVGGSVSTETIAFDKTSYAAGEGMTITRTAKDSAGNPVFDGAAAPAITFTKTVGGTAPAASFYVGGTRSSTSAGLQSVFAPAVSGAFSMNATSGNTAGTALTASATVTDGNAALLTQIDALNAKVVALNALIAKIMKKLGVK